MNTFQLGADQLKQTHEEMESLQAMELEEARLDIAIDTLEQIHLGQFYALCEIVGESPEISNFYASALQRVQVMDAVAGPSETREQEKGNLEAYFSLFDPEHPAYVGYLGRLANHVVEEPVQAPEPSTPSKPVDTEPAPAPEAPNTSIPEPTQEDVTPPPEDTPEKTSQTDTAVDRLNLTEREVAMLQVIIEQAPRDDYFPRSIFKFGSLVEDVQDLNQPYTRLAVKLQKAGIFVHNGKAKGGSKNKLDLDALAALGLLKVDEEQAEEPAPEAEVAPEPEATPALAPVERAPKQSSAETKKPQRMDSQNKLTHSGIMRSGNLRPYDVHEKEILTMLGESPRKAPISTRSIADQLGVSVEEARTALTTLEARLPKGWIQKNHTDNGPQWRMGSGIRIKG